MRELGVGLDAIAEIVHQGRDPVEVLRMHRKWLLAERDRFARLARHRLPHDRGPEGR